MLVVLKSYQNYQNGTGSNQLTTLEGGGGESVSRDSDSFYLIFYIPQPNIVSKQTCTPLKWGIQKRHFLYFFLTLSGLVLLMGFTIIYKIS